MSKQADSFSLFASSLATSGSTVVPPSVVTSSNAPDSGPSLVRPCYYLERPDGTLTALIEVDQLPDHIRIRGLTRKLSTTDTTGMTSVGIREVGQSRYIVEITESSANSQLGERINHIDPGNASVAIATTPSSKAPSDMMTVVNEEASTGTPTRTDSGTAISRPVVRKGQKVYCTFWIAKGECHFEQQGCKFKHEMPNLETLGNIMGRRSFPKWWLEKTGLISAPPQHLRHTATKRRAINPRPFALPAPPINTHTNSNSAPAPPTMAVSAPPEAFSNLVKSSSPNTVGNKFATRKDGGVDIRSHLSVASGSNMHSPVTGPSGSNTHSPVAGPSGSNMHSSVAGPSGGNIRIPFSHPSGGNIRSSISSPSAGNNRFSISGSIANNVRASISGPISSSSITQSKQPVREVRFTDLGSDTRPLIPGLSGNIVISGKQPVSNVGSPHDSSPSGRNMIQTQQAVSDERSPVSDTVTHTATQTTNQPNNILTTSTSAAHQTAEPDPLPIKIPRKYTPPFRVAALPTRSSSPLSSSATSMNKPRVSLPASPRQDIASYGLGNTIGGTDIVSSSLGGNANTNAGKNENRGAEVLGGRPNEGGIAYCTTTASTTGIDGSRSNRGNQMTRPYDEVFDLLGPFE